MSKAILTIFSVVFIITTTVAQKRTYFAAEAAVTNVFEIADHGGGLKDIPLISGLWGFNIRQDLNKKLFFETGLLRKYYNEGIGFKISSGFLKPMLSILGLYPFDSVQRLTFVKKKYILYLYWDLLMASIQITTTAIVVVLVL